MTHWSGFLRLFTLLGAFVTGAYAQTAQIAGTAYTRPHRLVEIEPGRRLNIHCTGTGSPTVILEGGITTSLIYWGLVQPELASDARTCSYDRAGLGYSDASPRASNAANNVDDLHRLLAAADIAPPYVFVGASAGGLYSRLYIYTYPREVVGLVLVDSSHEDQRDGFRKTDPRGLSETQWDLTVVEPPLAERRACIVAASAGTLTPGSEMFARCIYPHVAQFSTAVQEAEDRRQMTPAFQRTQYSEEEAWLRASAQQVRTAVRSLGDLPLIVLTRDRFPPRESATAEQIALMETRYQMWLGLARDLAAMSSNGQQRIVAGAGHDIQLDRPQAVIDAIREVLAAARARSGSN